MYDGEYPTSNPNFLPALQIQRVDAGRRANLPLLRLTQPVSRNDERELLQELRSKTNCLNLLKEDWNLAHHRIDRLHTANQRIADLVYAGTDCILKGTLKR